MIITKKSIPRRTVLRGLGASLALPLLDGMVPAMASAQNLASQPARRFGVVYVPNGMAMRNWTPATTGVGFDTSRILSGLAKHQERMLVLTGLNAVPSNSGVHASAATRFLTGVTPARSESNLHGGVSVDQLIAQQSGQATQLASLELGLDPRDVSGSCDVGFSCTYTSTIAWRNETTPLPMEPNPRAVFERLFGDAGTTDKAARLGQIKRERSILDSVTDKVATLTNEVGTGDREKIDQYLEAVRDIERRIQMAERQSDRELPEVDQPAGIPPVYADHAKLMFDLQVLAFQTDLTRVTTFMLGREISGRTYAEIGVPDSHHPTSHHRDDPTLYEKITKINEFHISLFGYYLDKLQATPDGDGSLLDHMILLYGAGMSDSNRHLSTGLPLMMVGGNNLFTGGRHLAFEEDSASKLLMTVLDKMGAPVEQMQNQAGTVELLSEV